MDSMSIEFQNVPGIVAPLAVSAPEGALSLEQLCGALFAMRVQIIRVEEEQRPGTVIRRLGVCEFHGGPLSPRRRRAITEQIARALALLADPLRPPSRATPSAALEPSSQRAA